MSGAKDEGSGIGAIYDIGNDMGMSTIQIPLLASMSAAPGIACPPCLLTPALPHLAYSPLPCFSSLPTAPGTTHPPCPQCPLRG